MKKADGYIRFDIGEFHKCDLKATEYLIMAYIRGFPNGFFASKQYLADCFKIQRSTLYAYIDNLIQKGYIEEKSIDDKIVLVSKMTQGECTKNGHSMFKNTQQVSENHTQGVRKSNTNNNIYNNNYNYIYNTDGQQERKRNYYETQRLYEKPKRSYDIEEFKRRAIEDDLIYKKKTDCNN